MREASKKASINSARCFTHYYVDMFLNALDQRPMLMKLIKRSYITGLLWIAMTPTQAQESVIAEIDQARLERVVALAMDHNAQRKILGVTEKSAKSNVTMAGLSFLNGVNASYFYRQRGRAVVNDLDPYLLNGFQLGIGISLASLISTPAQIKQSKRQLEIARLQIDDFERSLANEVRAKYYNYILVSNELKNRTIEVQDVRAQFERIQSSFELGETDFDTYTAARSSLTMANSALINTEVGFLIAKDELEALIGVPIESVN